MPSDVRQVLADAAAAEARGDITSAITALRRAAAMYREGGNATREAKILRHIARLEEEQPEVAPALTTTAELTERRPALADPALDAWCSFCCKPTREVGTLVAGPTGCFICVSCVGLSGTLLAGAPARAAPATSPAAITPAAKSELCAAEPFRPLPHQVAAWRVLSKGAAQLTLLLGPQGAGKTRLLAALDSTAKLVEVEQPLTVAQETALLRSGERVVLAVRGAPPAPALTLDGPDGAAALYDTPSLVKACAGLLSEMLLAEVDAVAVLEQPGPQSLRALAEALAAQRGLQLPGAALEQLVTMAEASGRGPRELEVLIARLAGGKEKPRG